MSFSISIFRTGQPDIAGVLVDTRLAELHESSSEPTLLPVDGSAPDVTDHVVLSPREVTISAWVGNIDGGGLPAAGVKATEAHQALVLLNRNRTRVDLVTQHELYSQMVLTNIQTVHGEDQTEAPGAIRVEATFTQVTQAKSQVLARPEANISKGGGTKGRDASKAASSKIEAGRKTSHTNDSSILATIVDEVTN